MWDLPRTGLEPVSPALGGGFLTTAPPGKSLFYISETLFNVWFKRRQVLMSVSSFILLQHVLLIAEFEENLASHRYAVRRVLN